jgi:hypothetical protein
MDKVMIKYLRRQSWSPYFVGASIGLLLTVLFASGFQIGVSSGISRISILLESFFFPIHSLTTPYLQKVLADGIVFDWKVLFIIGLFFGSLISSRLGDNQPRKNVFWENRFGPSTKKRYFGAFVGGMLLLLGARIADGCTSGHAISGGAQLSLTSWTFMITLFATAIPFSFLIYKKG